MRLFWAQPATLALLLLLASAPFSRAQNCIDYFSSLAANINDFGDFLVYTHPTNTPELTEPNTMLLSFDWTENALDPPEINQANSDSEYLEGVVTVPSMQINTISSLEGLPDYSSAWNTPKTMIQLEYNFPVIDDAVTFTTCTLSLTFPLEDMNTATPATDATEYATTLREDFPLSLTIPYLQVIVQDLDGEPPNNQLTATFDASCPLATEEAQYDGQGKNVTMTFMLTQKLDYDTMETANQICQVTVTDGGTNPGPKSTDLTITITVEGFEDEPPVFKSSIYTTTLDSQQAPAGPLSISPQAIEASDADKDGSAIVYTMTASEIDGPEWNDYFAIDESTADVTQVQDLPGSMLGEYSTHFILTATDGNNNFDTAVLEIVLPTATTTSTTSTSTTTTSTTPSTTTSTTPTTPATTPTTTPCPTPTTISTTTDTCPPCPTTIPYTTFTTFPPTTESCPPCPTTTPCVTPTTSSPTTESCPPCPTTTPCVTPTTFSPTTESCPPCPTTSTITSTDAATTSGPTTSTAPSSETVPSETCPPCTTIVNTCPTLPSTEDTSKSSSTTVPSTDGMETTVEIVTSSTEGGQTEPVCQTCDPCECTSSSTREPDGSSTTPPTNPGTDASVASTTVTIPSTTTAPESYIFERAAYNFELYPTSRVAGTLMVVEADNPDVYAKNVIYQWDESASGGTEYFKLDSSSGQVLVEQPEPGYYVLKATAVVDGSSETITTDVFMTVLTPASCDDIFIGQGLIYESIPESTSVDTPIVTIETQDGNEAKFCKVGVRPIEFKDAFDVTEEGVLILTEEVDVDEMPVGERSIAVWIKALQTDELCPSEIGDIDRSEVIVVVNIEDENDEAPQIVEPSSDFRVGYPTNKALQQVVGPVVNIVVEDKDTEGDLTLSLSGEDSDVFLLEGATGNLYLADPSSCSDDCEVTVTVSDGDNEEDQRKITVVPLNTENIFDIALGNMNTSEIQAEIERLSQSSGLDLHLLYSSVALSDENTGDVRVVGRVTSSRKRQRRDSNGLRDSSWVSVAHIYGFDDNGNYVSLEDLNTVLPDDEKASTFSEEETFSPASEATDVTGYQVAVGILGGLLVVILIGAVVGFFWYRKKKEQAPSGIDGPSTLGSAYPNHAFNTEMSEIDRYNGSSTSSRNDSTRVSVLAPNSVTENRHNATAPLENDYEEPIQPPFDMTDDNRFSTRDFSYGAGAAAGGMDRKSSQHSLGLHRIDPGPSPDGTKSSPYLTGSEGDFQASRPAQDETVASFTAYKGGQKSEDTSMIKVNSSYAPQYKKTPNVSFGSTREIEEEESKSRAESNASSKKSANGYGVSVRVKKEPPDVSAASPAKPIMKKKSVSVEVHKEPEAPLVAGSFAKLQSSPTVKKKKKTKTSSSSDEDTGKTKQEGTSENGASDSETKKSVAFKVLVDQKEIERINHGDDSENENL